MATDSEYYELMTKILNLRRCWYIKIRGGFVKWKVVEEKEK